MQISLGNKKSFGQRARLYPVYKMFCRVHNYNKCVILRFKKKKKKKKNGNKILINRTVTDI